MANNSDNIKKYAVGFIGFDEESINIHDSIRGYVGTVNNNPTRTTGWNGKGYAMSFNGTNQYVRFNGKLVPSGVKTVRFKIKTTLNNANPVNFISQTADYNVNYGMNIGVMNGTIRVVQGVGNFIIFSNSTISDGQWHDVAVSWDGTTNDDGVKIYIDDMINPDVTGKATKEDIGESPFNLFIGCNNFGTGSSSSNYFKGELDDIEIYDRIISPIPDKYLVLSGGEYKYHDGTSWQVTDATEENFINFGMEQLSQITETQWDELGEDVSVVMWSDFEDKKYVDVILEKDEYTARDIIGEEYDIIVIKNDDVEPQQLILDAVGQPQTVYPLSDISLFGVREISSVNVTGSGSGKVAISVNSGSTWNTYENGSWVTISDISQGMDFATFNTLTDTELKALLGDSKIIRFAYYLSGDTIINSVKMVVKMEGTPQFANKDDYDYTYDVATKTITYTIKKDGHFIINYLSV